MNEEWKNLVYQNKRFENFKVSNTGKLRNTMTNKEYKTYINHRGYSQVCVSLGSRNDKKVFKIHRCVAETFIPNTDNKPQINHIDGNKLNNYVSNLEWVTSQENMRHAFDTGLAYSKKGEDNSCAKLTSEQVRYIRESYIPGDKEFGCRSLANKFNVSHSRISDIVNNKTYKYA